MILLDHGYARRVFKLARRGSLENDFRFNTLINNLKRRFKYFVYIIPTGLQLIGQIFYNLCIKVTEIQPSEVNIWSGEPR